MLKDDTSMKFTLNHYIGLRNNVNIHLRIYKNETVIQKVNSEAQSMDSAGYEKQE